MKYYFSKVTKERGIESRIYSKEPEYFLQEDKRWCALLTQKKEEVRVLFNMAEGASTLKTQVAVQNGLVTNARKMGLLKTNKRT